MEFKEAIRTWVCPRCGHAERMLSDDGLDACRVRGNSVKETPHIGEVSSTALSTQWHFDDDYGAWHDSKKTTIFDPRKPQIEYYLPKCGHNQTHIKAGDYEVWATESCHVGWSGKRDVKPDFGVYLAGVWKLKFPGVLINDAACGCLGMKHPYPAIFVDWEDKEVISLDMYTKLVKFVIDKLEEGHSVEIGCQGAHGRTGTLIAGVIGKLENLDAAGAINTLRARYCKKAVESKAQVLLIQKYLIQEGCGGSTK